MHWFAPSEKDTDNAAARELEATVAKSVAETLEA
jgi:hypothetical protein